jgi:hypothetical protein
LELLDTFLLKLFFLGQYITELSRIFFLSLEGACKGFVDLFDGSSPPKNSVRRASDAASSTASVDVRSLRSQPASSPEPEARLAAAASSGSPSTSAEAGAAKISAKILSISVDVLAHLVYWIQSQIAIFAAIISRQAMRYS